MLSKMETETKSKVRSKKKEPPATTSKNVDVFLKTLRFKAPNIDIFKKILWSCAPVPKCLENVIDKTEENANVNVKKQCCHVRS